MLILASGSPRRSQLLHQMGVSFKVIIPHIDEIQHPFEKPAAYALRMAMEKASKILPQCNSEDIILAADTIVVLEDLILGKPKNREEAAHFLSLLGGRCHQVMSSYCLLRRKPALKILDIATTSVEVCPLSSTKIKSYLDKDEYIDKAGGYAIQGDFAQYVTHVEGSLNNVIGLPTEALQNHFQHLGVIG